MKNVVKVTMTKPKGKLTASNTVLDELWNDFKLTPEVEIRNRLGAFLFSGDDVKNQSACYLVAKKLVCF